MRFQWDLKYFRRILECERQDLFALVRERPAEERMDVLYLYARVLEAYWEGKNEELRELQAILAALPGTDETRLISSLAKLRLQIRELRVDWGLRDQLVSIDIEEPLASGERYFVCAMAADVSGDPERMRQDNEQAYHALLEGQAKKKAAKALHNVLAAKTRLAPAKNFLSEYFFLYRQARAAGAYGVAGTALHNLSMEYEKIGGLHPALKHANQAIVLLHRDFASKPFMLALAHRAHLLLRMHREQEAEVDIQFIEESKLVEVVHVARFLRYLKEQDSVTYSSIDRSKLPSAWQHKYDRNKLAAKEPDGAVKALSKQENHMIRLLQSKPLDKFELIEALYGGEKDVLKAENRLNNLLFRIRKKQPGLIVFQYNKYTLSTTSKQGALPRCVRPKKAGGSR